MSGELLLDTGALVTLLDRSQSHHVTFARFFESWNRPVLSTEAVLTETTHLLGRIPNGRRVCLEFFLQGAAILIPSTPSALRRAWELLGKYQDLPMNFADATLVVLAEDVGTDLILTADRHDFEIYRTRDRRRFKVVPA